MTSTGFTRRSLLVLSLDLLPVLPPSLALEFEEVPVEPCGPGMAHEVGGELFEA
jgi:hypothetical protein